MIKICIIFTKSLQTKVIYMQLWKNPAKLLNHCNVDVNLMTFQCSTPNLLQKHLNICLVHNIQSTVPNTDNFGTSIKCLSYKESNKGSKERQGPTVGGHLIDVFFKTELTVDLGCFPFNKNSGFTFQKFHVSNGTLHSSCTDPN